MDIKRYTKQLQVRAFDKKGQQILSDSHVVIIGAGGIGSNSANILVRMGIGSIDIYDDDLVELSNLHRTSIYTEDDIGKNKSTILEQQLIKINSTSHIRGIQKRITRKNIESITHDADVILDGTDNMETRFLINDVAVKHRIPWVYAGVAETTGMVMGIVPMKTPCLWCISQYISKSSNPSELGTFGIIPPIVACIQSMEAIKMLLGEHSSGLIIYDIWKQCFENIKMQRNPECRCCSTQIFEYLER